MSAAKESYVLIEDDAMLAWLYLTPPAEGEQYTQEFIYDFLKANGVRYGFHESNIAAIVKKHIYEREVKVAAGKPPAAGREGFYEYHFTPTNHRAPRIREDGTVDYASMNMLQNVAKGEKVATYHPAQQGEGGMDVRGQETPPQAVKELPPLRGRNIQRMVEENIYVSTIDGKICLEDGKLDVQSQHEIVGNVTLITPRIEFYGDVIINGNVETGVTIRAGRNVIIKGMAEAITVNAGGDIIIEKGINGGQKAKLAARGNIFVDYIEYTTVEAGGDVQANVIMNSHVNAKGKVILTGKRGSIIGGYTHGYLGVEAVNLGNDMEVHTLIHAGYKEETYNQYLNYLKIEQKNNKESAAVLTELTELLSRHKDSGSVLLAGQQARLAALIQKKKDLMEEKSRVKSEKEILNEEILKGQKAKIKASGKIYRGVSISIEMTTMPIENNTSFMIYKSQDGVIQTEVMIL